MQLINDSRKIFKELYPLKLISLVLAPVFIGVLIDYDLFDSRDIIINLIWVLIFTILYNVTHKKIIYQLSTIVYFLVGIIEITHWVILKGPLTITSLMVLANTNYNEAKDFLDLKASLGLFILIPYVTLFVSTFRNPPALNNSKQKSYLIIFFAIVSIIFIAENAINGRLVRKGVPQIVKVTCSFFDKMSLYKEAMQEKKPKNINANTTLKLNQQTFILILGESCSRRHMSIYGSQRKTNPKLCKRIDFIKFNDVVSAYSSTLNSVLSSLSNSNLENKINFEKSIDIIDVFHSAGFKTYWISNQSPIGIWDNLITILAKKADYSKFVNISSNSSFESILNTSYDSKLFTPFKTALNEDIDKKLIVLHLMGSHSSYSKRYPTAFDLFKGESSKDETIAEYDNSILYNDFIIDSLFTILNSSTVLKKNLITSAIYLSDHGENVYDEIDNVGHDFSKKIPQANVEIPFLVWLSPEYKKLLKNKSETIINNKNLPFVTDDLFHSILDLNGINCTYFEEEKSNFNEKYKGIRKRILEDGQDYDKK